MASSLSAFTELEHCWRNDRHTLSKWKHKPTHTQKIQADKYEENKSVLVVLAQ